MITINGKEYPDFRHEEFQKVYSIYITTYPDGDDPLDYFIAYGSRVLYYILLEANGKEIDFENLNLDMKGYSTDEAKYVFK